MPFFGDDDNYDPELTPLSLADAVMLYNKLTDRRLEFEDAFPDTEYDDA